MGDTLTTLLPYLSGSPLAFACFLLIRINAAISRAQLAEQEANRLAQKRLDEEMSLRRVAQEREAMLTREVGRLTAEVAALHRRLDAT